MKYFVNINNSEELRQAYRAYVISMHPDRGGNEEDFKAMQAEFKTAKTRCQNDTAGQNYTYTETAEERTHRQEEERREREEWERWEAEREAAREQEAREEAERLRKAQEECRRKVAEWADRLERVQTTAGPYDRFCHFEDKKAAAAFVAVTKRNIRAVINHYFPDLDVKVTISGEVWKEKFIISWQDGPSVAELRNTCMELRYFIPAVYESAGPCDDYGSYSSNEATAPWREAYGQALGDIDNFQTLRELSVEGKEQVEAQCADIFKNWNTPSLNGAKIKITLDEFFKFSKACGVDFNDSKIRWGMFVLYDEFESTTRTTFGYSHKSDLRQAARENFSVSVDKAAQQARKAAQFVPHYGAALANLLKLTRTRNKIAEGDRCVFYRREGVRNNYKTITISTAEAVEMMEQGKAVYYGIEHHYEDYQNEVSHYGIDQGGYKLQLKRAAKFAAFGYTLGGAGHNDTYGCVYICGITPETAAAIRKDLADVERQRKEWEEHLANPTAKTAQEATRKAAGRTKKGEAAGSKAARQNGRSGDENAAPAESLQLVEITGGVAVVPAEGCDYRATLFNRRQIKAHGCRWNKEAQQWEATDPDDVQRVRDWFAMRDGSAPVADEQPVEPVTGEQPTAAEAVMDEQPTAAEAETDSQQPTAGEPAVDEPKADSPQTGGDCDGSNYSTCEKSPLFEAVADLFRILAGICQEVKKFEGVTIPPETLRRWRRDAEAGAVDLTKRFAEVCACLSSLTPADRQEFDALGIIFMTLSEQLRQGYSPEGIAAATAYARAQLFDLMERTQTPQQAAAVRAAFSPDDYPDYFRAAV